VLRCHLDCLFLRLWVLDELLESASLDEEFNSILHMDAVISNVLVALMESTIFGFVDPFLLLRRSLWWLDASFLHIGYNHLGEDLLPGHGQGRVLGEVTSRYLAFTSYFAFLLFLVEGLFGGFISRLLLLGLVKVVRVQLLFIPYLDLCNHWELVKIPWAI